MLNKSGFTLLEIMISVAIISVLTTLSFPIYTQHMTKIRRMDATVFLHKISVELEKYYFAHETYEGVDIENMLTSTSMHKYYKIILSELSTESYVLTAIPISNQAREDTLCGSLSLDSSNKKAISGNGNINDCW